MARAVANSGPSPADAAGQGDAEPDAFALIRWLAAAHGQPFSETALQAGLPAGQDLRSPAGIARALGVVGLRARLVNAAPRAIEPGVLPCVLFRRNGGQAILTEIAPNRRTFTVIDPAAESLRIDMKTRAFAQEFTDEVLLVAPDTEATQSRLAPSVAAGGRQTGHWFWSAVHENWPAWVQIMVAAFCLNLLTLALPIFVMNVYDRVIPNVALVTLWTLALGVVIALALDLMLRTLRSSMLEGLGRRVDLKVAARIFDQAMSIRLTSRAGGAAGLANTIRDFESVREFFGSASFVALIDLAFIGVFIAALFFVVGPLAWVPLLAIPVVLALAFLTQIPLGRSAEKTQTLATKRHIVLVESLLGIEAIKSLNAEPVMQREWENTVAASTRIGGRTRFWSGLATNGTMLIQQSVSVGIIVWGVYLVSAGEITVGSLIAANILAGRVLAPMAAIAQTIFRAHYARRAMAALSEMMALPRERGETVESGLRVTRGAVELRDVSFRYEGAEQPAVAEVSLKIEPGEVVALLGRVGSGKTTLGKLMNGLLVPETGNILIDGHAQAQYDPAELRAGVGYLTQESELFTGTLRENMTVGRPRASDDEIREALYLAGMDAFLSASSEGLNVFIGEKGSRLSGGQRQGVALARLLLRKPKVLFLDEPTNSMDQQMESAVIERLREHGGGGTTMIFCTHRMSLADVADRFIVLDRGRKVLDGPKAHVLAQLRRAQTIRQEQLAAKPGKTEG